MNYIFIAILVLGIMALLSAIILFVVSKKFAIKEDPRVEQVLEALPGANCGGCGYAGCSAMADALVKGCDSGSTDGMSCPVGGSATMNKIAEILGMSMSESVPMIAVVRCSGTCSVRPKTAIYEGLKNCASMNLCASGETLCGYGCLGCGDCVEACNFNAIIINEKTGIPEVNAANCVSCGACVKACPRNIIELRQNREQGMVYVGCVNKEKGVIAKKGCEVACIGCGKCQKTCPNDAITISKNLSYIDYNKCVVCGSCVEVCPTKAIKLIKE